MKDKKLREDVEKMALLIDRDNERLLERLRKTEEILKRHDLVLKAILKK